MEDKIFLNSVIRSVITSVAGKDFNFGKDGIRLPDQEGALRGPKNAPRGALGELRVRVRYRNDIDVYLFVRNYDLYVLGYEALGGTKRFANGEGGDAIAQSWPSRNLAKELDAAKDLGYASDYGSLGWPKATDSTSCTCEDIRSALIQASGDAALGRSQFRHLALLMEACRFKHVAEKILQNEAITGEDVKWDAHPGSRLVRGKK